MMNRSGAIALLALILAGPALAEPTEVTVRVISQDAKFVGTSMGGALVTLRDAASGETLAEGLTTGGTGDTTQIMNSSGRSPVRATDDAAAFKATLDIDRPTLLDLQVHGPMGHEASALYVAQQRWVMPGRDVTAGGGWVVELNGLVIDPAIAVEGSNIIVQAKVSPMCGCPITPGGMWPAEEYEVEATLWLDGREEITSQLQFTSAPGGYAGSLLVPEGGESELWVTLYARNTRTGNSGYVEERVAVD